jgi:hypothetical protein
MSALHELLEAFTGHLKVILVLGQIDRLVEVDVGQVENAHSAVVRLKARGSGTGKAVLGEKVTQALCIALYSVLDAGLLTERLVLDSAAVSKALLLLGEAYVLSDNLRVMVI